MHSYSAPTLCKERENQYRKAGKVHASSLRVHINVHDVITPLNIEVLAELRPLEKSSTELSREVVKRWLFPLEADRMGSDHSSATCWLGTLIKSPNTAGPQFPGL